MWQVKVDERYSYEDVASVMAVANCYSTTEPHVDAVCDIYIQKIGPHYRVYVYVSVRTSLCSAVLRTYADNAALPAFTRRTPLMLSAGHVEIDRHLVPAGPMQQTCSNGFAAVGQCWYGQTEGRKPYRQADHAPHTMRAVSIICCIT